MTQTIEILARLVGFPSVSSTSNHDIIDYIEAFLKTRGFTLIRIADTAQPKAGLLAHIGPPGPGGIMLSGHSDVVPTAGQSWSSDAFTLRRESTRLYGRGTTDMKGYLAAMLNAADLASTRNLKQPLKLAFSWDEEVGCLGIPQMLPHMAQIGAPAMCFVGEPTGMNIATGHKGKIALTATCHGTAGHSANAPDYLNALHLAADFITALRSVQSDLAQGPSDPAYDTPYSTLHAGILTGGTALNIVPDRADITFELRHLPAEDPAAILARLNSAAQTITAQHPAAKITITQTSAYPGLQTAPDAPVTTCAQSLLPANTRLTKVAYGTEAGHISASGIPTVVCGPGNMAQGHKADEFIEIDQLAQCDAMLAALIERLAAGSV